MSTIGCVKRYPFSPLVVNFLLKHLAYLELAHIAKNGPSNRRVEIFTDQKAPSSWSRLSRECLLILGQHYAHLHRRGAPAPPPGRLLIHTIRSLLTTCPDHSRSNSLRSTSGTFHTSPLQHPPRTNLSPHTKILPRHVHQRPRFLDLRTTLYTFCSTRTALEPERKSNHPLYLRLQGPAESHRARTCIFCGPCTAGPPTVLVTWATVGSAFCVGLDQGEGAR